MKHSVLTFLYFVVMAAVIVLVDELFLRDHFWARLGTNIAIVAVFGTVYMVFLRHMLE